VIAVDAVVIIDILDAGGGVAEVIVLGCEGGSTTMNSDDRGTYTLFVKVTQGSPKSRARSPKSRSRSPKKVAHYYIDIFGTDGDVGSHLPRPGGRTELKVVLVVDRA